MKKLNILFFIILSYTNLFSQVGIGTTSPTKDLDINGELRIRNLPSKQKLIFSLAILMEI